MRTALSIIGYSLCSVLKYFAWLLTRIIDKIWQEIPEGIPERSIGGVTEGIARGGAYPEQIFL